MDDFSKREDFFFGALAAAIIVVCLLLVSLMLLSRPPDYYSELYFDVESLSEEAVVGEEISFKFFVENHEAREMDYNYSILLNSKEVFKDGFSLDDNAKKEIVEAVVFEKRGRNQKIEVMLKSELAEEYSVFFWVNVGEK